MQWGTVGDRQAVLIETNEDVYALKRDHEKFHEGALSILTFPTAGAMGFMNHDIPRSIGGFHFVAPTVLSKDEAGNFLFHATEEFTAS